MLKNISHHQIWVLDQDEALDFYVNKLGFEVNTDVQLEAMRWLTVNVPGDPQHQLILMAPQPPAVDAGAVDQVRDLVAKGAAGGMVIVHTDDCRADYERLREKGVEFTEEPTERFYGIDCGIRDPFGNHLRMTEPAPQPAKPPAAVS